MFVRKKKNRSGSISVAVISKTHGEVEEAKTFGFASFYWEAEQLCEHAQKWINICSGQQ
jgi:hypothetical protein